MMWSEWRIKKAQCISLEKIRISSPWPDDTLLPRLCPVIVVFLWLLSLASAHSSICSSESCPKSFILTQSWPSLQRVMLCKFGILQTEGSRIVSGPIPWLGPSASSQSVGKSSHFSVCPFVGFLLLKSPNAQEPMYSCGVGVWAPSLNSLWWNPHTGNQCLSLIALSRPWNLKPDFWKTQTRALKTHRLENPWAILTLQECSSTSDSKETPRNHWIRRQESISIQLYFLPSLKSISLG